MGYEVIASEAITEKDGRMPRIMGYGNSHKGYYRKNKRKKMGAMET